MADFLLNNAFRFSLCALNFLSPSVLTDILLHPFDFATVLVQIGFDPEGIKYETGTLVSVIVQYAIFTLYVPFLLTSMQGLHFMGMPHPRIFYYVNYIYNKEGFRGCYRGLLSKICERLTMISVNEKIRRRINKDSTRIPSSEVENGSQENFVQTLINSVCSQFFAVVVSHPFHVLMVSSFAEFTYDKKSSILELLHSIYTDDGYFGFFTGLTARLLGELVSLLFSITYTTIINKQRSSLNLDVDASVIPSAQNTTDNILNYLTDTSRPKSMKRGEPEVAVAEISGLRTSIAQHQISRIFVVIQKFLRDIIPNSSPQRTSLRESLNWQRNFPFLASRLFYYIMLRDFLSKKISHPFFLVCHCAIVLGTGWDKFPLVSNLHPLVEFIRIHLTPTGKKLDCPIFRKFKIKLQKAMKFSIGIINVPKDL